jgi:hypothetical protein
MVPYAEFVSDILPISHDNQLTLGEDRNSLGKILSFLQMMCSQDDRSVLVFDGL